MTLEDLIKNGEALASSVESNMFGDFYVNDRKCLSEWNAKALMYLQEYYPEKQQTKRFEFYVKKADGSLDSLETMIGILKAFNDICPADTKHKIDCTETLSKIFDNFHTCVNQLQHRHSNRPAIDIKDEYDVQYLLNALLRLHFDDVRPEEQTPSYAGSSNRMDFLLKDKEIAIEVKMTRDGLKDKEIGEQLVIDIKKYEVHPNCKSLYCFVYDPEGLIRNPRGLEKDLSSMTEKIDVKVYIRPL